MRFGFKQTSRLKIVSGVKFRAAARAIAKTVHPSAPVLITPLIHMRSQASTIVHRHDAVASVSDR